MKKYIAIVLSLVIALSFGACAKGEKTNEETTVASSFYDRDGIEYTNEEDVLFYDAEGNVYNKVMDEDYLPNFVNVETGESYFGMLCYISEDGYLYYDEDNSLDRIKGSLNTYQDSTGKKYYDISTVHWDDLGNLTHN